VIFGVGLFAFAGHPTPIRVLTFILCVIGSTIVVASFLILVSSLSFNARRTDGAELGFNAILLVSSYPIDIFSVAIKTAFFTLVPAAFIASVPAGLINHFNPTVAAELLVAASSSPPSPPSRSAPPSATTPPPPTGPAPSHSRFSPVEPSPTELDNHSTALRPEIS
jgi:ABC-2 family transporter protein